VSHESWLCAASLNANMANNRRVKRKLTSTFGEEVASGTFENQGGGVTLTNQSVSQGAPALSNTKGSIITNSPPDVAQTPLAGAIALTQQVVDAAAEIMSAGGQSGAAVQQGASLTMQGASGPALGAALAAQAENAKTAFHAGVALANGSTKVVAPPSLSPAGQAGYLITHGMVGAPSEVKGAIAAVVAQTPAARVGMVAGIAELKNWWHRVLRFLHLESSGGI